MNVTKQTQITNDNKRNLRVWEVIALSVGFMGPVMAMALNGIGVAGLVGKAVPFTFVLAFVGALLVGYGFIRLTGYFNHAGSVYALTGVTIGPKAGFFGGFALLGTYIFFVACILGAIGVFYEAWAQQLGGFWQDIPWLCVVVAAVILVALLNLRESKILTRILFYIGVLSIIAMLVLAIVIFIRVAGGTPAVAGAQWDWTPFLPGEANTVAILTASVFAFLSWAGFESGTSLGEETANPKRVIPKAIFGAIVVAGVLYTLIMFAQTLGFGTGEAGVAMFAESTSSLIDLAELYIGTPYAVLLGFLALIVAFAAALSSTAATARLIYALARDGFGMRQLGKLNSKTNVPTAAVVLTAALATVMAIAIALIGGSAFDVYYWYATIAILCMVVAYGMTSVGVTVYTVKSKKIPKWEMIIPILGLAYLLFVYAVQVIGQEAPYSYFPYVAGAWCLIGFVIVLLRPRLAKQIGARLTVEDLD